MNGEDNRDQDTHNGQKTVQKYDIRALLRQQSETHLKSQESKVEVETNQGAKIVILDDEMYEPNNVQNHGLNDGKWETVQKIKQSIKDDQDVPITTKSPVDKLINKRKRQRQIEAYKERHMEQIRDERAQRAQMRGVKRSSSPIEPDGGIDHGDDGSDRFKSPRKRVKFDLPDVISTDDNNEDQDNE